MKVSILTQPLHTNYGGTLQAFALQYVLKEFGCEPVTINYRKEPLDINPVRLFLSRLKQKIRHGRVVYSFTDKEIAVISQHHDSFINKYISRTKPIYRLSELKELYASEKFDAVIVGSDQTWRPRYSPRIDSFFLDFLKGDKSIKKIAYASSFGTDDWEFSDEQTKVFSNLLKEFDSLSVRESSAIGLCSKNFDVTPQHVLDPTLLLDKDVYLEMIKDTQSKGRGKVFNYVLDKSVEKKRIISKVCSLLDKESFSTYPEYSEKETRTINDFSFYIYPHIESWVKSFADADFIITDSFHGTVFSIIFNKPFIAVGNETRGKARFTSLLRMFNLEHRLISDVDDIDIELIEEVINFDDVNSTLQELRSASLLFLKKSLSL